MTMKSHRSPRRLGPAARIRTRRKLSIPESLTSEVNALRANTLDALLTNAQQAERELTRLTGLLSTIKSFDAGRYDSAVAAVAETEQCPPNRSPPTAQAALARVNRATPMRDNRLRP